MHRPLAVMLSLVVVAVLPAAVANAKGLTGVAVCGASGCVDRTQELGLSATVTEGLLSYGDSVADPGPTPFVRLKQHMGHAGQDTGTETSVYFPRFGIRRSDDGVFHLLAPDVRRALRRALVGVTPFAASALKPVKVAPYEGPDGTPTVASGAASNGGRDGTAASADGGRVPTGAWIAGGAALALLALSLMSWRRRRGAPSGRPATG
jgi:hypothetical protein